MIIAQPTESKCIQLTLDQHVTKTIGEQKTLLDRAIAKFFYSSGIPFRAAECHAFKEIVNLLRRVDISGSLLNEVHEDIKTVAMELNDTNVTLSIDCWTNVNI